MTATSSGTTSRAFLGLANLVVVLALVLFIPAGTFHWVRGWVLLGLFSASSLAITLYLARKDPALLKRRTQAGPAAEKEGVQKIIQAVASVLFLSIVAIPALDYRFEWSQVPVAAVVVGDILVLAGFGVVFCVFRENAFTSATIEVAPEQRVVESGPYAFVRHPMYAGALLLIGGIPLALGSLVGLALLVPFLAVIVWRLLAEERFLLGHLAGYDAYRQRIKWRLLPHVW